MYMTPDQIRLVQRSWAQVLPIQSKAAELFYERLFEEDTALRALFNSDMHEQRRKLIQMLALAVNNLSDLHALTPKLHELGARHAEYGVHHDDYATVGSALMWTLEQGLGSAFTPAVRDAWSDAFAWLAATMQEGANDSTSHAVTRQERRPRTTT
jgi:hemoglobin-like flavoprotein